MGYKVDSLQLELTVTAKQTASSLSKVANALAKIKKETKDMSALVNLRKELNKFSKVNLAPVADALNTIASSSVKAREKLSNMLAEVDKKAKLDVAFEPIGNTEFLNSFTNELQEASDKTDEFSKTINASAESFETSMGMVSDAASRISGSEKDADDAAKRFKETLKEQGDEQARIIKLAEKELSELKATNKELDKTGKSGKKSMLGLEKSIGGAYKALKRFAKYAGYRAIRSSFNAITTSFSEGLESAYMWSAEAENGYGVLADTMNELATGVSQVKRQLGAVAGEIMTKLGGVINTILNGINSIADSLTEFFAALNGEDTYMRAKRIDTTWQDISDDEKDATQKAKEYKKELLGIDELNVLGKDEKKGGAEAEEIKEPEYELAKVNRRSFAFELGANIKDVLFNWDNLNGEQIALKICGALGALTGFIIGTSIGGVTGGLAGAAIGFILGVGIGTILFDTEKAKYAPETAKQDIINTTFGSAAGAAIGFAVGGPLGAAIGLTIGAGVTLLIDTLHTTYEERIFEEYQKTDFWKDYREFMDETLPKALEKEKSIRLKIDSIDLNLTDAQVTNLELAKKLINDIFTLDEKDIKTPEEIEILKTKITELNGLGIEGVHLEYMEELGKVTGGTREELDKLIESLLHEARVEAGMAKYGELQKAIVETELELIEQNEILQERLDKQHTAYLALIGAEADYVQSEREIASATNEAQRMFGLYNPALVLGEENLAKLQKRQEDARKSIDVYTLALNDANEMVEEQSKVIELLNEDKDKATEKSEILMGLINDEKAAWNKDTKAVNKNDTALGELDETTDKLIDTTGDLKDGLKDVKDQMGKTKDMSPKLQKAIDSIKGSFNNLKTSIAESISELGKLDEAGKTKRTIELDYAVGVNMNDAAMIAMIKGLKNAGVMAGGGFAQGGHLFFANENGNPEYIGNMGGRTAVANSDQMAAAIEEASFRGMARALSQYGNKNNNSDWQPMSAQDMYLLLKRTSTNESRRTGNVSLA